RPAARTQFFLVVIAFACLAASFIGNDFSVQNVATNSNSELPLRYRFAATWGSHEGSLLLWRLMLTGWTFAVSVFSRHLPPALLARVIAVMGLVSVGFLLFMLFTSNPFDRLIPAAPEGRDLNPLLQDPGMVIHPPMLYMGYVGLSVAFSFAVAALIGGQLDATWARWTRPWTTAAWIFLTIGIALGSGWAYYELGWRFALVSRETMLLGNNVLLVVACGAVLLGTLYPLVLDALLHQKISVGPPYFDTVFVPLLTPLVFLLGVGPLARWKEATLP